MLDLHRELTPRVFKELVAAGSISGATVRGGAKGLVVILRVGMTERVLGEARGGIRHFQRIDGAASILWQAGIREFNVDTTHWTPKTLMGKSSDD
jgi:hypothetical protein